MRNLNDRQRVVLGVGLVLLVASVLFPPYECELYQGRQRPTSVSGEGFKCILLPPKSSGYRIITSQWLIQGGVIILVTLGALAIAAKEPSEEREPGWAKLLKWCRWPLNDWQRIMLGAGLCFVFVSFAFPPYTGKYANSNSYIGYSFILAPPGPRDAFRAKNGKELEEWQQEVKELKKTEALTGWRSQVTFDTPSLPVDPPSLSNNTVLTSYSAHILTSQWLIQGGVIILVTFGALAIAATKESEAEGKE